MLLQKFVNLYIYFVFCRVMLVTSCEFRQWTESFFTLHAGQLEAPNIPKCDYLQLYYFNSVSFVSSVLMQFVTNYYLLLLLLNLVLSGIIKVFALNESILCNLYFCRSFLALLKRKRQFQRFPNPADINP